MKKKRKPDKKWFFYYYFFNQSNGWCILHCKSNGNGGFVRLHYNYYIMSGNNGQVKLLLFHKQRNGSFNKRI